MGRMWGHSCKFGTLRMKQKSSQPSSGVKRRKEGKDAAEGMDLNAPWSSMKKDIVLLEDNF